MIFDQSTVQSLASAVDDRDELRAAIVRRLTKIKLLADDAHTNAKNRRKIDELLRDAGEDLDEDQRAQAREIERRFARDEKLFDRAKTQLRSLRHEEAEASMTIEWLMLRRIFELGIEISDLKGLR
jgi:outer membrane PBP1 activator LpoA protein